jgi:hypothetical protein
MPRYLDWCAATGGSWNEPLLLETLVAAEGFALGSMPAPSLSLVRRVEEATPSEMTGIPWFTSAQDCWVCADSALRVSLAQFNAEDAAWYLLEPMFQATSERLFGVTDVGSERQEEDEVRALADDRLAIAVSSVETAIRELSQVERLTPEDLENCLSIVNAIRP